MNRLSVSEFCSLRSSFFQDVIRCAAIGFGSIGALRCKVDEFGYEQAADLLYEMQMDVSSLSWAGGFTGSCGLSHKFAIEDAIHAVYQAHMIGAKILVIHPGGKNGHTDRHANNLFHKAIDAILPTAIDLGVHLAIEPVITRQNPWNFYCDFLMNVEVVREYSPEHVGLVLDLYHVGQEQMVMANLDEICELISLVQLADTRKASHLDKNPTEDSRCQLGEGNIQIDQWILELAEIGYEGPIELELHGPDFETCDYADVLNDSVRFLEASNIPGLSLTSS